MAKKQMLFKTKGMNQDLSVSAFNPEFAFENMNLRLSTNEGNTLLSWVNEKGTSKIKNSDDTDIELVGIPIGTAILNHRLIVFTTSNTNANPNPLTEGKHDYIYVLEYTDEEKSKMQFVQYNRHDYLYNGNLNFCTKNPLETLVSYEAENIQKVYWVDGRNQPRVVNLESTNILDALDTQFDFVPTLQLKELISVEKLVGSAGIFAPGVIQYAFTYYNKHGQESNIFYTTPLYYISPIDRGGKPDEKVDNAFRINIEDVDTNFEYLRIYSIQRTSINATPICKRIQDIYLKGLVPNEDGVVTASFLDTGTSGDTVDPTELLYKGGETITAETIEQKDGTLFLGNIKTIRNENITLAEGCAVTDIGVTGRKIHPHVVSSSGYVYENQLFATDGQASGNIGMSCAGFKCGDTYRCGVQFQHKSGKWSHPIWIQDYKIRQRCSYTANSSDPIISLPRIQGHLSKTACDNAVNLGYVKARAVVVFPTMQDRETICQGVINPTLSSRLLDYSQASWFFRFQVRMTQTGTTINFPYTRSNGAVAPVSLQYYPGTSYDDPYEMWNEHLPYFVKGDGENVEPWNSSKFPWGPDVPPRTTSQETIKFMRSIEVQGVYDVYNAYLINNNQWTLHSPELEFNDEMYSTDFTNSQYRRVGDVKATRTLSDILIETESPTVSGNASGFIHKSFNETGPYGIVGGLFYDDYLVDDRIGDDNHLGPYPPEQASGKWLVCPWQMNGSLNNDFNRPSDKGTQTAKLKKKVISNLRFATTSLYSGPASNLANTTNFQYTPQLYSSDEASILKIGGNIYHGNVDTMFSPDTACANYLCLEGIAWKSSAAGVANYHVWEWNKNPTSFTSNTWLKTYSRSFTSQEGNSLLKYYEDSETGEESWYDINSDLGDDYVDLVLKKSGIRMKYKSSPHLVINPKYNDRIYLKDEDWTLPVVEICKKATNLFGGTTKDALRENTWIPCGEPVLITNAPNTGTNFLYDYGDTYFQRYDCLKTYPFTREDPNQIVEIGSFMLETHVNIDGRYDRNRGQQNNINMTPQNFNLMNPVYSQVDNFFSYKIVDDEFYENTSYPNQITWSKTKNNGADTDLWTNITMASVLELDGDKGEVTSIKRLNDQLLCFQDSGISQILYNENVQVSTEQGVPIEIANSGKVQGKRYLSNTVGCSNKWSMVNTPAGIYFMDSNDKSIYRLGEGLQNVSQQGGFNTWCKQHIPASDVKWSTNDFENFVGHYDKQNQDVLFINNNTALAFSEKLNAFTSFYDYGHTPYLCNLDDTGIWISYFAQEEEVEGPDEAPHNEMVSKISLWKHQAGDYCSFFGTEKPYWMTLVGNPDPQIDKIFTNLEFRACVEGDGELDEETGKFTPTLPFDSLETWNEYQHGFTTLENKNGHDAMIHGTDSSSLKRKFRIWRSDIPRNNYELLSVPNRDDYETDEEYNAAVETYNTWSQGEIEKGISRKIRKPNDRMRNPWLYLKLQKNAAEEGKTLDKAEIHDIVLTYFG